MFVSSDVSHMERDWRDDSSELNELTVISWLFSTLLPFNMDPSPGKPGETFEYHLHHNSLQRLCLHFIGAYTPSRRFTTG